MYGNYPKPFNPTTSIRFALKKKSKVRLKIFDIAGKCVATLFDNDKLDKGEHTIKFNASNLTSGV